jgi:hypothetical protein
MQGRSPFETSTARNGDAVAIWETRNFEVTRSSRKHITLLKDFLDLFLAEA